MSSSSRKSKLGSMFEAAKSIQGRDPEDLPLARRNPDDSAATWIQLDKLVPGRMQPRSYFDDQKIEDLAKTFSNTGFKGVINVRDAEDGTYEIVAGERRWRAAKLANLSKVACIVSEFSDEQALEFGLFENVLREDLSTLETLEGVLKLLQYRHGLEVGSDESRQWVIDHIFSDGHADRRRTGASSEKWHVTEETLASLDISPETILKWLRLLNIPDEIRQAHIAGRLAFTKALEIAKLKDRSLWEPLLLEAVDKNLSKRELQKRVREQKDAAKSKAQKDQPNKAVKMIERMNAIHKLTKSPSFWKGKDEAAVRKVEEKINELEDLLEALE